MTAQYLELLAKVKSICVCLGGWGGLHLKWVFFKIIFHLKYKGISIRDPRPLKGNTAGRWKFPGASRVFRRGGPTWDKAREAGRTRGSRPSEGTRNACSADGLGRADRGDEAKQTDPTKGR